jgi:uncharacterized protein YecE (DUF72 family)
MIDTIEYKIGCSGFYNKHWKGVFYPNDMAQQKWFNFYCEHFSTLELNTTFYRFPKLDLLQGWYDKSPEDFIMSVKAPRIITHLKKFKDCETLLDDFYDVCEKGLGHKLGPLLFQLPPSIPYKAETLENICNKLRAGFVNVLEFRHESWWTKEVYTLLEARGIIFCSVSHPKLPDQVIINSDTAYIRLHGVPEMFYSAYSTRQMQNLLDITKQNERLRKVFIYFNNTAGIEGIRNAVELQSIIRAGQ